MAKSTTRIITARQSFGQYWAEIWQYRHVLGAFVSRDLKLRYKQTALGIIWVVLQPLLSTALFTLIFQSVFQTSTTLDASSTVPYTLFVFSGLTFWTFFSDGLNLGVNSLLNQADLIKKIYFPRVLIPFSSLAVATINFVLVLVMLLISTLFFNLPWRWEFWAILPGLYLALLLTTGGVTLFLAALNLKYRDVKQVLPFLTQILLFLAPVVYPLGILPASIAWLAYLNPLTAIINLARWGLFGTTLPTLGNLLLSGVSLLVIMIVGWVYFRHTERYFADLV